jgi:hypothetical protein
MRDLSIGEKRYRIDAVERDGRWIARAVLVGTGDPFGTECAGETRGSAIERLARWLDWQHEHAAALDALQQAERAYHRTIAGSVFASPTEGPTPIELQKESLELVEGARVRLDDLRSRKPE